MSTRVPATVLALSFLALVGCTDAPSTAPSAPSEGSLQANVRAAHAVAIPCADLVLCMGSCAAGDAECKAECTQLGSTSASVRARELDACVSAAACSANDSECAQTRCAPQVSACVSDGRSPGQG